MRPTTDKLYNDVFAVGDKLYCIWDTNLPALNSEFLDKVDHDYFRYLADTHSKELEGSNKLRAAVALHTAYFHGMETLFSLIFAGLQAPRAIPAWILKCRTEQLRTLVEDATANIPLAKSEFALKENSWASIADFFNGVALHGNKEQDKGATDFGELWKMFAQDYANKNLLLAYNSFKHGFRVKLGGMKIAFAPASTANPDDSANQYQELGKCECGSSFHEATAIQGAPKLKSDRHFRVKDCYVNCYPEYAAESLRLISISICNVVSCLKSLNDGKIVSGILPDGIDWLNELRQKKDGLTEFVSDMAISEKDIKRFNEEELNKIFEAKRVEIKITKSDNEASV